MATMTDKMLNAEKKTLWCWSSNEQFGIVNDKTEKMLAFQALATCLGQKRT